jgi:cellulose synthase/poly-beta-1,6-N-acetylglucosamine synthase-like glycosyltransferase
LPKRLFGLAWVLNRSIATLPLVRRFCVRHYVLARSRRHIGLEAPSVSIIIPCRNERGNVAPAVERTPQFCPDMEIIFVEGHSRDDTKSEIERVIAEHPDRDIKLFVQKGVGKADAVHLGFAEARGEVLMILDGDLTVPPEAATISFPSSFHGCSTSASRTRCAARRC